MTVHTRPPADPPSKLRRSSRYQTLAVRIIAAVVAVVAAASTARPTGLRVIDALYVGAWAGALVLAGSRARRWTWLVATGATGFVVRETVWSTIVWAALAVAVVTVVVDYRSRIIGALISTAVVLGLLHTGTGRNGLLVIAVVGVVSGCLLVSGVKNCPRKVRKRVRTVAAIAAVVLAVVALFFFIGLVSARNSVEGALADARTGLLKARNDDPEGATNSLHRSADGFDEAANELDEWWIKPAHLLPGVRQQVDALQTMAAEGQAVANASSVVSEAAGNAPLSFKAGKVDLPQLARLSDPLAKLSDTLAHSQSVVADIPTTWLLPLVSDRRLQFEDRLAEASDNTSLAREVVDVAPTLFGGDRPRHYFVAMMTPDEARGRTGFMGDYSEIVIDNGTMQLVQSGRTTNLERTGGRTEQAARTIAGPADFVARYGRFEPAQTIRNIPMSPDFPSVGTALEEVYPQITGTQIDGVISIDVDALSTLLQFTGAINVPKQNVRIDADSARDFFLTKQYVQFTDNEVRQEVLDEVVNKAFDKLTHADLPAPNVLAKTFGPMVDGGHLVAHGVDPAVQHLFERLGVSGGMTPVQGDYLAVVNNNAGGNKTDLYLSRTVKYDARFDPTTGHVTGGVDVTMHNAAPSSGLPDYIIGNALGQNRNPDDVIPPGTNRTYVSIYSPLAIRGATLNGLPLQMETAQERGRYAYSAFLDIPSGADRTVHIDLEGNISAPDYRLDIDRQPLVTPDQVDVSVALTGPYHLHPSDGMTLTGDTAHANGALEQNRTYLVSVSRT